MSSTCAPWTLVKNSGDPCQPTALLFSGRAPRQARDLQLRSLCHVGPSKSLNLATESHIKAAATDICTCTSTLYLPQTAVPLSAAREAAKPCKHAHQAGSSMLANNAAIDSTTHSDGTSNHTEYLQPLVVHDKGRSIAVPKHT